MARRANGEGTIKQTPTGKYRAVVQIDGHWISGPVVEKRADALRALQSKLRRLKSPGSQTTLSNLVSKYINDMEANRIYEPTTAYIRRSLHEKHISNSAIGALPASLVTQNDLDQFLRGPLGGQSQRRSIGALVCATLRTVGIELKLVVPKDAEPDTIAVPPEDRTKLIEACTSDEDKLLLCLMMRLGLRKGEALGVMHEDRQGEGFWVRRQINQTPGKVLVKGLKTARSERWVPLEEWMKPMIGEGQGFVFQKQSAKGLPRNPSYPTALLLRLCRDAGTRHYSPHSLRRTAATAFLEAGVDVVTAASILGHDPAVLMRLYMKTREDLKLDAVKKIGGLGC
jgi:integrase